MNVELDAWHFSRALSRYVNTFGDSAPDNFATVVEAITRRSPPFVTIQVDGSHVPAHDALVTFTDTAAQLDCHPNTVGRMVKRGALVKVGRRITASSLEALMVAPALRSTSYAKGQARP